MTLAAHRNAPADLRSPDAIAAEVKRRLVASRRAEIRQVSPLPTAEPAPTGLLRRPRLLAQAAREGAKMYRRDRDLRASLPGMTGPRKGIDIVSRLLGIEAQIEAERQAGTYAYSPLHHVQVLSALVAEMLALKARQAEG